ncbi:hypothetical protein QWY85_02120 [Neolewinella lacunae]|uniref:Toxin-antitoxin system YwqK family antitoxin n=1 Tax=Neolewinella lacunae TaxID=1517758 RepID=A0A923TAP5_9BACT|nr:hypothetical protein [Neolewinella lacunae]MBC6996699.1 hypothetical protein [Neolewinella lacunae]MDN3633436.1 hypothetical protein [Neolewinella lacunae]
MLPTAMRYLLPILLFLFLFRCQNAPAPVAVETAVIDSLEYVISPIPGTTTLRAEKRDPLGALVEAGFVLNGLKQGTWTTYDGGEAAPRKIVSYVDGALNGPYLELDELGRIAVLANYKANVLHGSYGKYKIGRPELTASYIDGQLDGTMAEFDYRNNKIKQEATYRMGVLHGPFRYFNEEGKITLEYVYQNGERVSGGIVE